MTLADLVEEKRFFNTTSLKGTFSAIIQRGVISAASYRYILNPYAFSEWLQKKYPVEVLEFETERTNCYAYALGVDSIAQGLAHEMQNVQTTDRKDLKANDLIWYFGKQGVPVHAGIVQENGLIKSQWGAMLVIQHPIDVVPLCYGTTHQITYTKRLTSEQLQVAIDVHSSLRSGLKSVFSPQRISKIINTQLCNTK